MERDSSAITGIAISSLERGWDGCNLILRKESGIIIYLSAISPTRKPNGEKQRKEDLTNEDT